MATVLPLAGVVRVSHMGSRKPDDPNVHTEREQVDMIKMEGKRLRTPVALLSPEFDVKGRWALERRPALLAAVEGVEQGRYSGVIVAYLSRFGRSTREQLAAWDRIEAAGGRVVVVREQIDTSTPTGRYVRTILLANEERIVEEHAERFEAMREWATAAGIWQRRQTPKGYARNPGTRRLTRNADAPAVEQAWTDRLREVPVTAIAERLGLTPSAVRKLLSNRVYLGELRVGKHVNLKAHPPISDDDDFPSIFEEVQKLQVPRSRSAATPSILAGLVRCRSCGHAMHRGTSNGSYRSYRCIAQHSAGRCPAPTGVATGRLADFVIPIALAELDKLKARAAGAGREIAAARKAATDARRELAAYLEGVEAAGVEPSDWATGARQRRERAEDAEENLRVLLDRQPASAIAGNPREHWERMDLQQRNRLLRRLIECIIVVPVGRGKNVPIGDRTRVVAAGSGLVERYRGGGVAMPIRELPFPDLDDPVVLRI